MEIPRLNQGRTKPSLGPSRVAKPVRSNTAPSPSHQGGDSFVAHADEPADTPFWLIALSADLAAGRQFLSAVDRQAARPLEAAWIAAWVERLPSLSSPQPPMRGREPLAAWQALVGELLTASGLESCPLPQVVWQPNWPAADSSAAPVRGQFVFRVAGSLIQLRPEPAGAAPTAPPSDWLATVAHETFHAAQMALVAALYQGQPLAPPFDSLAAFYRDARILYRPNLAPRADAAQDLEVGAWRFGEAVAKGRGRSD